LSWSLTCFFSRCRCCRYPVVLQAGSARYFVRGVCPGTQRALWLKAVRSGRALHPDGHVLGPFASYCGGVSIFCAIPGWDRMAGDGCGRTLKFLSLSSLPVLPCPDVCIAVSWLFEHKLSKHLSRPDRLTQVADWVHICAGLLWAGLLFFNCFPLGAASVGALLERSGLASLCLQSISFRCCEESTPVFFFQCLVCR
jgi:hypothetical protein